MDLKDRIKEIEKVEDLTREELARKIGITYTRLRNLVGGQTKFRMEDLEAISSVFPEYEYWIYTGKEMPVGGQISPMTKMEAVRKEWDEYRMKRIADLKDFRKLKPLHPEEEWELEELEVNGISPIEFWKKRSAKKNGNMPPFPSNDE